MATKPPSPTSRPLLFLAILAVGAALAVPTAVIAQSAGDVSRTTDGHILHRRPPERNAGATADPTPETPVFIYDPARAEGLPNELQRDGRSLTRPDDSLEPENDEPIHTAEGPKPTEAPELPPPGPQSIDPSAPPSTAPGTPPPADGPEVDPIDMPPSALAPNESDVEPPDAPSDSPPRSPDSPAPADPTELDPSGDPHNTEPEPPPDPRPIDPRTQMGDEAMPDRQTGREGRLDYREVFDPSIVPHKRNRALDQVGPDFGVRLGERRMKPLALVGNRLERGREVFWGSLLIEGVAGARIPIPSVAPEARILSYEASPAQEVRFWVDQAGNHYIEAARDGRLRLVYMTDAPASYFGRSLPRHASFGDVPLALRPRLPKNVQEEALEVAGALGFSTNLGYSPLLERMVAYFRSFEPGDPPPSTGNVYRDIALSRRGICRHRAHAFVVTAQALGYPARFVFNEAHAFVEVFIPGDAAGWLRIDLGGGADELRVHNTQSKTMHEPLVPDPFERPAGFDDMAGASRITGLPETNDQPGDGPSVGETVGLPSIIPRATEVPGATRSQTTLRIDRQLVTRGDGLEIHGEVRGGGAPIDGGVVQVLLVTPDTGQAVALLGTAPVIAGRYRADVRIPAGQATGDYELVVEFLGHDSFGPSIGR